MKRLITFACLIILSIIPSAYADVFGKNVVIQEEDGSPKGVVRTLKVTDDTLTQNSPGDYSLATGGAGGSGDSVTVNSTAIDTTANFLDNLYIDFAVADGGAGGPDDITGKFNYAETLAGNPALLTTEIVFTADGLLAEGTTADTIEIKLAFPDPATTDKTLTLPNETGTLCSTGSVCTGYQAGALTGDVTTIGAAATIAANAVALSTDTTGNFVATIADAGNSNITVANSGTEDAAVTLDVVDVTCTDCIGTTEIADSYVLNTSDTMSGTLAVGGLLTAQANLTVGNGATTAGVLTLLEDTDAGANFASFQVPALAANTVYTLPANDGDASQFLQTDGAGSLTWAASAGSGDITDVFSCASGDCASITMAATDLLDMSGTDASTATEGLILPQHATACAGGTAEGQVCWEADANILHIGDAATIVDFVPTSAFSGDATVSTTGAVTIADSVTVTGWVLGTSSATQLTSPTVIVDLLDASGAVDMDYGSADVTDHTFIADGTTDADFVVPLTSIGAGEIVTDTITATQLNSTLTFADGDLLDLNAINNSTTTEGLILPQGTDVSAGTAEGQIGWDTDNDQLKVGTGAAQLSIGKFPFGGSADTNYSATFRVRGMGAANNAGWNAPFAIKLSGQLDCRTENAPGAGNSWLCEIDSPTAVDACTCTISGTNQVCQDAVCEENATTTATSINAHFTESGTATGTNGEGYSLSGYPLE